jgi:hypothetical protein
MNLMRELDRLTEPQGASRVRTLSADEVANLERTGRITPLEQIPKSHAMTRSSVPRNRLEFIR